MKKRLVAGLALAGALAVAAPMVAHAWGGGERCADGPRAGMMHKHGHHHGKHGMHGERGMYGERGMHGDRMGGRGFMGDLQLSEEQRGKLAELRKANAPAMQEQAKAMREARRELRALGFSADYDEAKARAIAERAAKAAAEMAAQRAKAANDFYQVLTPEQRQKFSERMARMEERRAGKREGRQGPAERSDLYGPDAGPRV